MKPETVTDDHEHTDVCSSKKDNIQSDLQAKVDVIPQTKED
jgi:hypothetical protein